MHLLKLSIDRIITHQIYRRDTNGDIVPPHQSQEYTIFDRPAMEKFKQRVREAIGEKSNAVQMKIVHQGQNDLVTLVDQMVDQGEDDFAESSFDIALKLAKDQDRKNYPGGLLVIFLGTQGMDSKKVFGIIKAEVHSGYEKKVNQITNEISLRYVEELLLTPGTKLYKTAGFIEKETYDGVSEDLNDKWNVLISDNQINKAEGKVAAQYFYEKFLGCGYPETSARTTKQFYEAAFKFIHDLNIPALEKNDLLNALTIYLRTDASPTASTSEFAERYFDVDTQDLFTEHMEEKGLPNTAFTKDTDHIKNKLKVRSIKFSSNVKITAPPEVLENLVTFETIEGDIDESGTPAEWTKVTIKDRITKQE